MNVQIISETPKMPRQHDETDPKGLIYESYRMEGIQSAECRSIFLDWALGVPIGVDSRDFVIRLLNKHGTAAPDHPMTAVLKEALDTPAKSRRKGGAMGRRRGQA